MALTNTPLVNEVVVVAGGAAPIVASKAKSGRTSEPATKTTAEVTGSSRKPAATAKTKPNAKPAKAAETKASIVVKKLRSPKGVTIDILMEATGWQAHSVRGFLSAVVKKRLGLTLITAIGKDGVRRYRVEDAVRSK